MGKNNQDNFIEKLNNLPIVPDKDWQLTTYQYLNRMIQKDVPKKESLRNRFVNFNFLIFSTMNTKAKLFVALGVGICVLLIGGTTAYAAEASVPGDFLYSVDKAMESLQRSFTNDPEKSAQLEMDILDERMQELERLQERKESQERINEAVQEVEAQRERVQERVRNMEEKHNEGEVEDQAKERVMNRYENQNETHNEIMEQVKNQNQKNKDIDSTDSLNVNVSDSEDTQGEPGGVGVQQRPQDQDRDGSIGEGGSNEGDSDKPREGWD
ncbi:hypothetical protein JW766_00675 [Candidatus Dojkabacteria bacterium]|nr:hypothetical protein [Candidatus Dojkabacteria bacterium]